MAKNRTIQLYRGTTAQNETFTGAAGEVTVDTQTHELRVHDGSTVGGHIIYTKADVDTALSSKADADNVYTKTDVDTALSSKADADKVCYPDLFDVKWADHELDDMSWLRADTFSWQDGTVYSNAYLHLLSDISVLYPNLYRWDGTGGAYCYTASATPSVNDPIFSGIGVSGIVQNVGVYVASISGNTITSNTNVSYTRNSSGDVTNYYALQNNLVTTETVAGTTINFYLTPDGHKICLETQESKVASIYASTGIAWYYILDFVNTRFKLPRTKFGFNGYRDGVGNYIAPGLPNITGTITQGYGTWRTLSATGALGVSGSQSTQARGESGSSTKAIDIDASRSSVIYGNSTTVQPPATQMYLYFYVGQFSQSATEQTAGLNASLFNNKVDLTSSWSAPSSNYVNLAIPAHGGTVQAPADGWICVHGYAGAGAYVWLQNNTNGLGQSAPTGSNGSDVWCNIPVKKGDIVMVGYYGGGLKYCRFIYAVKSN